MNSLPPIVAAVTAYLSEVPPTQLAIASVTGFIGMFYFIPFLAFYTFISIVLLSTGYAFWVQPTAATILAIGVIFFYLLYVKWVFGEWEKSFSGHRLTRGAESCASNKQMPDIMGLERNKSRILENAKYHENFDDCELLHTVEEIKKSTHENRAFRKRAARTGTITAAKAALIQQVLEEEKQGSLGAEKAKELDMDHIYVKFSDFLWGYTFIVPFSYILWKRRTLVLQFRKFLQKFGLISPAAECDYEALAATLVLEQTQAIHYYGRTRDHLELGNIAGFFFADFPYVDENCNFQIANLFAVDIDLDTKRFKKAKLDNAVLTAKEAVTLLWYNTIAAQHVKLHAMANWGVNLDDSLKDVNPFLRQNGVVTTMYNFFGYSMFSRFLQIWTDQGLLSDGWTKPHAPLIKSFNHGIKENVWQHGQIQELVKYSRFVKFAVKVRAIFLAEFAEHKDLFPGIDGEAMFVGTVLHSLDHTLMDWNLKDALYLDTTDNRFGKMAEMGQVVKVGFVSDVDGLYFHKRFKGSGHPFYDAVYKKAAGIDKELADNMDTCIIK